MEFDSIYLIYWSLLLVSGVGGLVLGMWISKKTGEGIGFVATLLASVPALFASMRWFHLAYSQAMGGTIAWFFALAVPIVSFPFYLVLVWMTLRKWGQRG